MLVSDYAISDGKMTVNVSGNGFERLMTVSRLLADGDTNTKTRKNGKDAHLSCGLSLAPHKLSGVGNLCGSASPACIDACLNATGLGSVFPTIQASRIAKAHLFQAERQWFLERLREDLSKWERKASKQGLKLCCRLNMFSDVQWERFAIVEDFPNVQFYDYSKHVKRLLGGNALASNYWVTLSRSETNNAQCIDALSRGVNVAVVFHNRGAFAGNRAGKQKLPKTWNGYRVHDGDIDDRRFLDPRGRKHGVVIGLRLKAPNNAQRQAAIESGFSVPC